jgi:hypothetical protein
MVAELGSPEAAREEQAYVLGVQAYLWGYPLYAYALTDAAAERAGATGRNQFHKFTTLKTAQDRYVVTPNNVTIDAYGQADLGHEPAVLYVPTLAEPRWYLVQIGDNFDEVAANIGGRKGPQPGTYVLTGPDHHGPVPGDMLQVRLRTSRGIVAARIFVNGQADLPNAVQAQAGFQLLPLSGYLRDGLAYQHPDPAFSQPAASQAPKELRFFEVLGQAMTERLSRRADTDDPFVASLRLVGLSVTGGFAWERLDAAARRGLARAVTAGEQIVDAAWQTTGETTNGWRYTMAGGRAGHDLALRAALVKNQLGAQLADQVLYPNTAVDDKGDPLTGSYAYVLRFEPGQQPPVATFWNLAMYDADNFFVDNQLGRYTIGSTTDGLQPDPDGSLTIAIQHQPPNDTSNWLPAPAGPFNLTLRFYGPDTSVLDGSYRLPAIQRVS